MSFKLADAFVDVDFRTEGAKAAIDKAAQGAKATVKVDADTAAVEEKLASLKARKLKVDADIIGASQKLDQLKAAAQDATGDRKLKIDADVAAAEARLEALKSKAKSIEASAARVKVDVDSEGAISELEFVDRERERLDGKRVNIDVDVDALGAMAGIRALGSSISGLGSNAAVGINPIVIGVAAIAPAILPAIGAITGLGATAAMMFGSLTLGLSGISEAITALGEANDDSVGQAQAATAAHKQMASAIDGVKQAKSALGNTEANVKAQMESSTRAVKDAERSYREALEDEKRAQDAVNDARRKAEERLASLQRQTEDMALSQESASISVERAQENLNRINADATSTALDRREASLRLAEAEQRLTEVTEDAKRLAEEKADADRRGVEGSTEVVAAQGRVIDAHRATSDAQRRVTEATLDAKEQQRQAAYAIEQAQHAVVQAQERVREASQAAGAAGTSAMKNLNDAMADLTPTGQAFAKFLRGFIDGPIKDLKAAAQDNLLPGLQRGLEDLAPIIENRITPAMGKFSEKLGGFLAGVIPDIGDLGASLVDLGASGFDNLSKAIDGILDGVKGALPGIKGAFDGFSSTLPAMGKAIGNAFESAFGNPDVMRRSGEIIGETLTNVIKLMGPLLRFFTTAGAAFANFVDLAAMGWGRVFDALGGGTGVIDNLKRAWGPLGEAISSAWEAFEDFAAASTDESRVETFRTLVERIKSTWEPLKEFLGTVFEEAWKLVKHVWSTQVQPWITDTLIPWLKVKIEEGIKAIFKAAVEKSVTEIAALPKKAADALSSLVVRVTTPVRDAMSGVTTRIKDGITSSVTDLSGFPKRANTALSSLVSKVTTPVADAMSGATKRVKDGIGDIVDSFKGLPGRVSSSTDTLKSNLNAVGTWIRTSVFDKLTDSLGKIPGKFAAAVSAIKSTWASFATTAQKPVKWAVDNVFNRVVDIWNTIVSKIPGVDRLNTGGTIPGVPGFASGGKVSGAGTGTSDDVPIMASDGEWVIREKAASSLGPRAMSAINNADRLGLQVSGDESGMTIRQKYADGGIVQKVKDWLPSLTSIPYVWGGVGPNGYDCSGITGEAFARLTGRASYQRYMTTSSDFGALGFARGTGMYTIGVDPGSHMAGRLDGIGFEAPSTGHNLRVGSSAKSVGSFPEQWYLKSLGEGGGDGGLSPLEIAKAAAKKAVDALTGGWWSDLGSMGYFGKVGISLGKKLISGLFDDGGWMPTGTSLVTNRTGRPEAVLTPGQSEALRSIASGGNDGGSIGGTHYHFAEGSVVLDASKVQDMADVVAMVKNLTATSRAYGGR